MKRYLILVKLNLDNMMKNKDKAVATLFYTYYKRTDIKDGVKRPIFFSFNGGPGAASIWMHMGYTSPRTLNIDDEGFPTQPYGIKDNPYSIIDVADIVYVNPVNVGLSRILDKDYDRANFFGVNSDIKYLAQWIEDFINKFYFDFRIVLLIPFFISSIFKTVQGSSTVAIITTSTIMYPLLGSFGLDNEIDKIKYLNRLDIYLALLFRRYRTQFTIYKTTFK